MNYIEIFQGNAQNVQVTVTSDGSARDCTGQSMKLLVKKNKADSAYTIEKTAAPADIVSNVITFGLSASDTNIAPGDYFFEVFDDTDKLTVDCSPYEILRVKDSIV